MFWNGITASDGLSGIGGSPLAATRCGRLALCRLWRAAAALGRALLRKSRSFITSATGFPDRDRRRLLRRYDRASLPNAGLSAAGSGKWP